MTSNSGNKLINASIIFLAVVAGVLGYFVYEKYAPIKIDNKKGNEAAVGEATGPLNYEAMSDKDLVRALPNSAEASSDTLQQFSLEVIERVVETNSVTIGSECVSNPPIAAIAMGESMTFKNEDKKAHTLQISPDIILTIPAHKSASIKIDFATGPGMYGYPCDEFKVLTGMLVVS